MLLFWSIHLPKDHPDPGQNNRKDGGRAPLGSTDQHHVSVGAWWVSPLTSRPLSAGITWGKVVSLYSVAAGLAVDCVRQAQPAMVHALVDCLGEFVRKTLATWLRRRGGWVSNALCGDGVAGPGLGSRTA